MAEEFEIDDDLRPIDVPPLAAADHCTLSRRVDGKKHSWVFDGDDPYIVCAYCDEVRDAITGLVIRNGRTR